jgi:hypothetical protein
MNERHGSSKSPEYKAWVNMLQRCNNPNTKLKGLEAQPLVFDFFDRGLRIYQPRPGLSVGAVTLAFDRMTEHARRVLLRHAGPTQRGRDGVAE